MDDLDVELAEIFECGLFIFPVYEHRSARLIIQHLINRGICVEEIAESLEDSENDIEMWLNRGGRHMVGEWVMAWINDARKEYKHENKAYRKLVKERKSKNPSNVSICSTSEDSDTERTEVSDVGSPTELLSFFESEEHFNKETDSSENDRKETEAIASNRYQTNNIPIAAKSLPSINSPPPLPPQRNMVRSMSFLTDLNEIYDVIKFKNDIDHEKSCTSSNKTLQNDYESIGNPDDTGEGIYMTIPEVRGTHCKDEDSITINQTNDIDNNANKPEPIYSKYKMRRYSFIVDKSGLPICPNCTCKLAYYSFTKHKLFVNEKKHKNNSDNYLKYLSTEIAGRAHDIIADSLRKAGPGFIFVMTDCLTQCLPWSTDCRYNIASSRLPERWLMEFRSNSVDVEIIWKVQVENHIRAIKEVHSMLNEYKIENDWYKCPLSVIVNAVSKVAKKYKKDGDH